jgi:hypothetical protein
VADAPRRRRAWEGFDWTVLSRLHAAGLIADPVGRAKSVVLVAERPGDVWMLVVRDEAGPRRGPTNQTGIQRRPQRRSEGERASFPVRLPRRKARRGEPGGLSLMSRGTSIDRQTRSRPNGSREKRPDRDGLLHSVEPWTRKILCIFPWCRERHGRRPLMRPSHQIKLPLLSIGPVQSQPVRSPRASALNRADGSVSMAAGKG